MIDYKRALLSRIKNAFSLQPWYGVSVMKTLNAISYQNVNKCPDTLERKSIANLIAHMIVWKEFIIRKLDNDHDFDIALSSNKDWPETYISDDIEWKKLLSRLENCHQNILSRIEAKPEPEFLENVPGKNYKWMFAIDGVIQHDIYHLGQINLVKKLLGSERCTPI
ncbi:MAG: DinB family protein [Saprospiraceae bacterium]